MFYEFQQNNSGGGFVIEAERGISSYVTIEANDAQHANYLAGRLGIYFDGVDRGDDCSCCGDRWYEVYESDGDEVASHYGQPLIDAQVFSMLREDVPVMFVHLLNGMIIPLHVHEKRLIYRGGELPVGVLGEKS